MTWLLNFLDVLRAVCESDVCRMGHCLGSCASYAVGECGGRQHLHSTLRSAEPSTGCTRTPRASFWRSIRADKDHDGAGSTLAHRTRSHYAASPRNRAMVAASTTGR